MNMLSVVDPLQNEVFFDRDSIGLAILNSDLSSFVHDLLRTTIKDPAAIIEIDNSRRVYIRMNKSFEISVVNVVLKDIIWYAENVDIEMSNEKLLELISKNKVIYKK